MELAQQIRATAFGLLQNRSMVERHEIGQAVLERLVVEALAGDSRFYSKHGGLHWMLASRQASDELGRLRKEEAEANAVGQSLEPVQSGGTWFGNEAA